MPRIERALALFMVVSWRIAHLMRMGRTCPDLPAELMFDDDEIKAAYVLNKKPPPLAQPSPNEVVRHVAMLGGFLARKGDGEPGVKTLWLGMQRVMDFAAECDLYARVRQRGNLCVMAWLLPCPQAPSWPLRAP